TTAKVKRVNGQEQIQALVDKQKVIMTEESIRHDFKFNDVEGTLCLPNDTIFKELARMGVLNLETTKTAQAKDIANIKKRVKRLERERKLRTPGIKRLYKIGLSTRVESSANEESLGEADASRQERISDIDSNQDIYLVNVHRDEDIFGVNDQDDTLMFDADKDLQG
nr:hypothetical protein [Tanacetum cinerariifolium]